METDAVVERDGPGQGVMLMAVPVIMGVIVPMVMRVSVIVGVIVIVVMAVPVVVAVVMHDNSLQYPCRSGT